MNEQEQMRLAAGLGIGTAAAVVEMTIAEVERVVAVGYRLPARAVRVLLALGSHVRRPDERRCGAALVGSTGLSDARAIRGAGRESIRLDEAALLKGRALPCLASASQANVPARPAVFGIAGRVAACVASGRCGRARRIATGDTRLPTGSSRWAAATYNGPGATCHGLRSAVSASGLPALCVRTGGTGTAGYTHLAAALEVGVAAPVAVASTGFGASRTGSWFVTAGAIHQRRNAQRHNRGALQTSIHRLTSGTRASHAAWRGTSSGPQFSEREARS
jgi:hypothetical protein